MSDYTVHIDITAADDQLAARKARRIAQWFAASDELVHVTTAEDWGDHVTGCPGTGTPGCTAPTTNDATTTTGGAG